MLSIRRDVSLAQYSTFQIGGPADFFVAVTTVGELTEALEYAKENRLPVFVFSGGSNILFADSGWRGLIIQVANRAIRVSGTRILADAGASLRDIVQIACERSLAGIESLSGIPGSLGGAIRGNAGAFGTEMKDIVSSVKVYDRRTATLKEWSRADCHFRYRQSAFKERPELVILSAVLELVPGERTELLHKARATEEKRERKHPQAARCAGSFFMNPQVTHQKLLAEFEHDTGVPAKDGKLPAGWLIDHVGLRGKRIGGAEISSRHPNYLVNVGGAKAEDVIMLASLAKQRVRSTLGVQLKEEVQYVGF